MIDVAFLGTNVRPAGTAVVIDVLRASSTITLALASGYERVRVAGTLEEGRDLRADHRVLAGEVNSEPADGFDLGNSPEETLEPRGTELVLATTNGAPAIVAAAEAADEVLVASLLNFDAILRELGGSDDVLFVCAGTNGRETIEDVYLAGRLSAALEGERRDGAQMAELVAASFRDAREALEASAGAVGVREAGLESDIAFCAQESIVDCVPRLTGMADGIAIIETTETAATTSAAGVGEDHENQ